MTGTSDTGWRPRGGRGGLQLQEGRLVYASRKRPLPWQYLMVLQPDGAHLWRSGVLAEVAPWDRHAHAADGRGLRTGWWVRVGWIDRSAYLPSALLWGEPEQERVERRLILANRLSWGKYDPFLLEQTLAALTDYLADVPASRPGLAHPDRIASLLEALGDQRWGPHHAKGEPLMGDDFDLYWAVGRAVHRHGPKQYGGRPVVDWDPADHLDLIEALLPDRLRGPGARERLLEYTGTWRAKPWPFEVLRG